MARLDDTQISVVIPTCRQQFLQATLAGLGHQQANHGFEVIVVENGDANTKTRELVSRFSTELDITCVFDATANLNRARNIGVRSAAAPLIAIIDDDCIPGPTWIEEILKSHNNFPAAGVIGGRCELAFHKPPPLWLTGHLRGVLSELHWPEGPRKLSHDEWLVGANISFWRGVFDAVNGFDETIGMRGRTPPQLCGDEVEFCQRIEGALKLENLYDPAVRVRHQIPPSRVTLQYFENRYYGQGFSNAMITSKDDTIQDQSRKVKYLLTKTYDSHRVRSIECSASKLNEPYCSQFLFASACCLIALRRGTFDGIKSLLEQTELDLGDYQTSGGIDFGAGGVCDEYIQKALTCGGHRLWKMVSAEDADSWEISVKNLERALKLRREIEDNVVSASELS